MNKLTQRQLEIYNFVKNYIILKGYPPSLREIASHFRITPRGAQINIRALEKKGYIKKGKGSRTITLVDRKESILVPVKGKIAAGSAIEMFEIIDEEIEVPLVMLRGNGDYFALKVQGDSMIDAHIIDGDFVVLKRQYTAHNGAIVAAVVDGKATLKKFYIKDNVVELVPQNKEYQTIRLSPEDVRIVGVMVGLIRIF